MRPTRPPSSRPTSDFRLSNLRLLGKLAACALYDPYRPLLAQIVVTRRCNLACGYCFEHDAKAAPVAFATLCDRVEQLARLRCVFVTLNGGEPLLHPDVVPLTARIRARGMTPMMNTNGLLLTGAMIDALGDAGLHGLQMSLDGEHDHPMSKKSLDRLAPILERLAVRARFRVRVNLVLGASPPDEALTAARFTHALGLDTQVSLMRDARGRTLPLSPEHQQAYREIRALTGRLPAHLHDRFQLPLSRGETVAWKCRSGARYFHVSADGKVHLCQPREGLPGIPLRDYTPEDLRRAFHQKKTCATSCPHAYAHLGSRLDRFRSQRDPDPEGTP